ncbi:MAG: hypothetical protein ABMB14_38710, partial [Myxococcota bacterium]
MSAPTDPHLARLHAASKAEQALDAAEHTRLDGLPLDDQVFAGHAWPPVEVVSVEPEGGRTRVILRVARGVLLHDGISAGDTVWLDAGEDRWAATVDDVGVRDAELRG